MQEGSEEWSTQLRILMHNNDYAALMSLINKNNVNTRMYGGHIIVVMISMHSGCTSAFLQHLLDCGVNLNNECIHHAVVCWPVSLVEMLLKAGADVNTKNARGKTPLMIAADADNMPMARCLVQYGATWRKDFMYCYGEKTTHYRVGVYYYSMLERSAGVNTLPGDDEDVK